MKKLLTVMAIGSATLLTAQQYDSSENPSYESYPTNAPSYSQSYPTQSQDFNRQTSWGTQSGATYNQGSAQSSWGTAQTSPNRQSGNAPEGSDQDIMQKIQDKIGSGWFSKGYQGVNYDVRNGTVTLRGSVETPEDKSKVEDSVRKINGVRQVFNLIIIRPAQSASSDYRSRDSYTTSSDKNFPNDFASTQQDRDLNNKIRSKLSGTWFGKSYDTLVLRTNNGFVVISGFVEKPEDLQKINERLKDIQGIRSLNNQVQVRAQNQ